MFSRGIRRQLKSLTPSGLSPSRSAYLHASSTATNSDYNSRSAFGSFNSQSKWNDRSTERPGNYRNSTAEQGSRPPWQPNSRRSSETEQGARKPWQPGSFGGSKPDHGSRNPWQSGSYRGSAAEQRTRHPGSHRDPRAEHGTRPPWKMGDFRKAIPRKNPILSQPQQSPDSITSRQERARRLIDMKIDWRKGQVHSKTPTGSMSRLPRNEQINATMISFVSLDGKREGECRLDDVLRTMDRDLHVLVQVDSSQQLPVCRLFLRKVLHEREKISRKKMNQQKKMTKEQTIEMTAAITDHDLAIKKKKIANILKRGRRVVVIIELKSKDFSVDRRNIIGESIIEELKDLCSNISPPVVQKYIWSVSLQGKRPKDDVEFDPDIDSLE
ncbi:hypothetical protein H4R24_001459 [Coemansia sp. RSA 988]|nr:hypothetical protein H4R24_001459 [Coemansia sp. RSA 988]